MLEVFIRIWINNLKTSEIHFQPVSTIHNFLFLTYHDKVGSTLFQDLSGSDQSSLIVALRQNNRLLVLSCFLLHTINE